MIHRSLVLKYFEVERCLRLAHVSDPTEETMALRARNPQGARKHEACPAPTRRSHERARNPMSTKPTGPKDASERREPAQGSTLEPHGHRHDGGVPAKSNKI